MDTKEFFDSKYLNATDLKGREHTVTVDRVEAATFDNGKRPVLYFQGRSKGVILNKTNTGKLASQYGTDMDAWTGKQVIIYPDKVEFNGNMVDCIRLRPYLPAASGGDDGIPF